MAEEYIFEEILANKAFMYPENNRKNETEKIIEKYSFDWDIVDVVIGGKSSIDLSRLTIESFSDAHNFLKIYGYDLSVPKINEEIKSIFNEALSFIEDVLLPDPFTRETKLKIPDEIKHVDDLRNLLLISSDHSNNLQSWACAVLRVMHTISHVNNDISLKFFPEIQRQILERIWAAIYVNEKGEKFFGDDETGIKIYDVDIKARKERTSTILKLLHKIENVAADVFDKIGVRIITYDKMDALMVIRFLRRNGIIDFPNVKPTRSINKLLNIKIMKKIINHYKEKLLNGQIDREEFETLVRQETERNPEVSELESSTINPHTSNEYKSIQFTCRQMIRMRYPDNSADNEISNFTFFFPYEMQVVDIKTHTENQFGKASHEKYKEKQLINARVRVLGKLLRENISKNKGIN